MEEAITKHAAFKVQKQHPTIGEVQDTAATEMQQ
jgi:hypothetical protein